jgi:hypothetical protein
VDHLTFAVSAALAQVLTNLDNLAVLLALLLTLGRARAVGGFVIAQAVVLAAAMGLAIGADQALSGWVGYLGIVPIALGLHALWQQSGVDGGGRGQRSAATRRAGGAHPVVSVDVSGQFCGHGAAFGGQSAGVPLFGPYGCSCSGSGDRGAFDPIVTAGDPKRALGWQIGAPRSCGDDTGRPVCADKQRHRYDLGGCSHTRCASMYQ